jgi:hypothetical protein
MQKAKTTCKQGEKDVWKSKQREKQTMTTLEQRGKVKFQWNLVHEKHYNSRWCTSHNNSSLSPQHNVLRSILWHDNFTVLP